MQSSSAVRNHAHKLPPLKESASRLASKLSGDASTTSSPDIATLLERFDEPLRDGTGPASPPARPAVAPSRPQGLARPPAEGNGVARPPAPKHMVAPAATRKSRLPSKGLITALLGIALVPTAVLLWQRMPDAGHEVAPSEELSVASAPASTSSAQPEQSSSALEVALSSPDRIEANAGEVVDFPIAIDATATLPSRSIVAITALPEGASFSEGRPYGVTGWSLRPDEIGGLRLRLPARSATSDMRLELIAGDGTVLSQSATRLSVIPAPAVVATTDDPLSAPSEQTATAGAIESAPAEQIATAEVTGSVAEAPPLPQQKPSSSIKSDSAPKVNTVKVVTIAPPGEAKPHDGGYGLGPATEAAQAPGEWMETKTAVDIHAKAEQSSETVKVAEGGLKVRVTGRDKRWVQVTDPKSSTTGWIYDRFLTPAEAPAQ
jgi:hypothetical protein